MACLHGRPTKREEEREEEMKRVTKRVEWEVDVWYRGGWRSYNTHDSLREAKRAVKDAMGELWDKARIVRVDITEKRTICR